MGDFRDWLVVRVHAEVADPDVLLGCGVAGGLFGDPVQDGGWSFLQVVSRDRGAAALVAWLDAFGQGAGCGSQAVPGPGLRLSALEGIASPP